ncbi:hypothetical protein TRVA0_021S01640 [Trichomonascus vanleenenianus]|uniref:uncharacterized protein n=1 Tax=Trichomonascus vanleenenianus TaxID=2268995 RepID=UPI003ECAC6B6
MSFQFRLKNIAEAALPTVSEAAASALKLKDEIFTSWTKGKKHTPRGQAVDTYHTRIEGDFWMARYSKHKDVSFDQFKRGIFDNHTENEVKYIPLLHSFKELKAPESDPGWRGILVRYKFPRMFSDREMTVWITCVQPDPEVEQFVVISLPSTEEIHDKSVTQAHYCSIEVITYNAEEQCVEWLMAQTSDARGNIPRWIQDRSVTHSVVEDVPSFIEWAKTNL